jgi:hypothetical protein
VWDTIARRAQQRCHPAVAIAAILASQRDDVGGQGCLVIRRRRNLALRRAVLPQNPARQTFGYPEFLDSLLNAGTAARGA